MPFKIGNNANPNDRPRKAPDPRSEMVQEFCKKNQKSIEDVGNLLLNKALKEEQPWAIKLAMKCSILNLAPTRLLKRTPHTTS